MVINAPKSEKIQQKSGYFRRNWEIQQKVVIFCDFRHFGQKCQNPALNTVGFGSFSQSGRSKTRESVVFIASEGSQNLMGISQNVDFQ